MAIVIPILSEFKPEGVDKAISEFKNLEGAGAKAGFAVKKAAVPAGLALAGLAAAGIDAAKAAMEDEAAANELARAFKIATGATDKQADALATYIDNLALATGVADDELRPAMASLSRATLDADKAQQLLALSLDIAAGTGKGVTEVADALGKAANGSTKGLKSLDASLIPLIKDGADTDELFGLLSTTFSGAASEAANTAEGKFQRLSLSLSETKETIGAALLPAIEAVLPYLQGLAQWASDNTGTFLIIAGVIGGLATAIVAINVATKIWEATTAAFTAVQTIFNAVLAANPIVLVALAVAGLVAGLVIAYQKIDIVRDTIDGLWGALKVVGGFIKDVFVGYIKLLRAEISLIVDVVEGVAGAIKSAFKAAFNFVASAWNNTVGKVEFKVPDWVPGIGGKGFSIPDIPMLAQGGIVTKPTLAMIGEAGSEAVIPLSKLGNMGGGDTYNITVQGAIDPVSTAYQIRQILNSDATRLGRSVFV